MTEQISEYRIIKGKIVKVKTIYFTKFDNHGGNVRIDKVVKH